MVSTDGEEVEIEIAVEGPIAVAGVGGEEVESVGLFRCELATGPGGACEGFRDGEIALISRFSKPREPVWLTVVSQLP